MNYQEALRYLQEVRENGTKLSLENIQRIIDQLPFSLNNIKFIQVAGTNGKGSTSHFIANILIASGYKVGLFTSPHLQNIRERVTINKNWISEDQFALEIGRIRDFVRQLLDKNLIDNSPTFFEHLLLLALFYFNSQEADYAVLEVGLGGRLDATTAITPVVNVITNIALEHTKTLGRRIRDIAFEKAGIAKKAVPLVSACRKYSIANRVIRDVCESKGALFYRVFDKQNQLHSDYKDNKYHCSYRTPRENYHFDIQMNGSHQTLNAATAIKAIEVMKRDSKLNSETDNRVISLDSISRGIRENFVPGRIEEIEASPPIIIDGGHNVDGIAVLASHLKTRRFRNCTLIFGVLRDKKYKKMVEILLPYIKHVLLVTPRSNRALPLQKLSPLFIEKQVTEYGDNYSEALERARVIGKQILITGSIYMIGEMRNLIIGE